MFPPVNMKGIGPYSTFIQTSTKSRNILQSCFPKAVGQVPFKEKKATKQMQKYLELKHHTLILLISKANSSHSEIIHSSRNRRDGVFRDNTNPRALKLCTKISVEDTNLESSHTFRPTPLYNLPLNLPLLPLFITSPTLFPISPVNSYSLHASC
jgi:hypothetical protein